MSEENQTPESATTAELPQANELDLLKARADTLGIAYKGNIGVDALKKKIDDKLAGKAPEAAEAQAAAAAEEPVKTKAQLEVEIRERLRKDKMKLLRCKIYNLDPSKNDLHGDFITVGNRYLGTVRKYIPYGEATDNGYHIPQVIYDELKNRKFQQIRMKKVNGRDIPESRLVPEFAIEVLPQLTPEQLNELALNQQAAARVGLQN